MSDANRGRHPMSFQKKVAFAGGSALDVPGRAPPLPIRFVHAVRCGWNQPTDTLDCCCSRGRVDCASERFPVPNKKKRCAMKRSLISGCCALVVTASGAARAAGGIETEVDAVYAQSEALYLDLHQHPELSSHELQTA